MDETHSKSKLKRKKSSSENIRPDTFSRDTKRKTLSSSDSDSAQKKTPDSLCWWRRDQLSAAESLWAFTLKSALPYLEQQQSWDLVPDLPLPSTARPPSPPLDEGWCDLSEEVSPLPEPASPSPEPSPSPDPLRPCSSLQDVPLQTKPEHHAESQDGNTASFQVISKKHRPSLHSWKEEEEEGGFSSAGPSGFRAGPSKGELLDNQVMEGRDEEEVVKGTGAEEEMGSVIGRGGGEGGSGGGGGGRLQSCPMCLLAFPLGFTQMDCDGHLAQCLSEMNVDMTW